MCSLYSKTCNRPFPKRGSDGTSNKGQEYEVRLPALFSLILFEDSTVEDFMISPNVKHFGKFDDLLITVTKADGIRENYTFQLKHKDKRQLPAQCLMKNKDFAISEYCKTYVGIKEKDDYNFILYTNGYFPENIESPFFKITEHGEYPGKLYFFKPSTKDCQNKAKVYKFEVNDSTFYKENMTKEVCDAFFEKFVFFSYQQIWSEVQQSVIEMFERWLISESIALKFIDFFRLLKLQRFTNVRVSKEDIKIKILDFTLSNYILNSDVNETNKYLVLLEKVIKKFDVTIVEWKAQEIFKNFSNMYVIEDNESLLKLAKDSKFLTRDITLEEFSKDNKMQTEIKQKIGYYIKGQPIILKVNESNVETVTAVINKFKKKGDSLCYICNGSNITKQHFPDLKVFKTLYDLLELDENLYTEIIKRCRLILFEKEYFYEELFGFDQEIAKYVSIKELCQMLEGNFYIDVFMEKLPNPYITRTVTITLIESQSINKILNDFVIINCENELSVTHLKRVLYTRKFLDGNKYLQKQNLILTSEDVVVFKFETNSESAWNTWNEICQRNAGKNIHYLEVFSEKFLWWVSSKGSIKELKKCTIKKRWHVREKLIPSIFKNKINLLVADTGMGKSEILKNLKNSYSGRYFPILINLKEQNEFFNKEQKYQDVFQHLLHPSNDNYFLIKVMQNFAREKKIIFFLDGLDELCPDHVNDVLGHIEQLSLNFNVWISSRPNLQNQIEDKLSVFSVNIRNFTKKDQKQYIEKRLQVTNRNVDQTIEMIFKNMKIISENCDILAIPLQLFMITEIVIQKFETVEGNIYILTQMFYYFVNGRYNLHVSRMYNSNSRFLENIINDSKIYRSEQYQIAALKSCFSRKEFLRLSLKHNAKFLQTIRQQGDFLGILSNVIDNRAIFNHNIIAEYFAALWLAENYSAIKTFLIDTIFQEKYRNIKLMFDMILAENCPAHLAVLYRDIEELKRHKNKILCDKGGRTRLHLACSHVREYPDVEDFSCESVCYDVVSDMKQRDRDYEKILEILLEFEDPFKTDSIFGWNAFKYIDSSFFLLPLEVFLKKNYHRTYNIFELDIVKSQKKKIIYHSALLSYTRIFETLFRPENFTKNETEHLFHTAAICNDWNVLNKILLNCKVDINCKTAFYQRTPLHLAALHGHTEAIRLLCFKNADVKCLDRYHRSPFHLAAEGLTERHIHGMKELLEAGADPDICDKFGKTPFHLAVESGNMKSVEFLVDLIDINLAMRNGWTPLHLAVFEGHGDIIKLLLNKGADINKLDNFGCKVMHLAAKRCNKDITKVLLDMAKKVDDPTLDGRTCLHLAAEFGHEEIVTFLLGEGADVNAIDNGGKTALHLAAIRGHIEVARILLTKEELMVEASDKSGKNALQWAAESGNSDMVNLLVEKDTYVDGKLLHRAFSEDYSGIVRYLRQSSGHATSPDNEEMKGKHESF